MADPRTPIPFYRATDVKPKSYNSDLPGFVTEYHDLSTMESLLEPYFITSVPCILLSIMTITLNIFVINYYRKNKLSPVPLLYTMISGVDILTAVGVIHQSIAISLFTRGVISESTLDHNTVICYTLTQISYRSSVFYNLVLAVSRTVMILRPFQRIKIKAVIVVCVLYVVPWVAIAGIDIHQIYVVEKKFTQGLYIKYVVMGSGLATMITDPFGSRWFIVLIALLMFAFLIPVLIIIITCVVQVISLHRPNQFPASSNQRHVTITVILMSTLFVVCNSGFYGYLFSMLLGLAPRTLETLIVCIPVFGTVLPILDSALNPVIIISRGRGLRVKFLDTMRTIMDRIREESRKLLGRFRKQMNEAELPCN